MAGHGTTDHTPCPRTPVVAGEDTFRQAVPRHYEKRTALAPPPQQGCSPAPPRDAAPTSHRKVKRPLRASTSALCLACAPRRFASRRGQTPELPQTNSENLAHSVWVRVTSCVSPHTHIHTRTSQHTLYTLLCVRAGFFLPASFSSLHTITGIHPSKTRCDVKAYLDTNI